MERNQIDASIAQVEERFVVEHSANVDETVNLIEREVTESRSSERQLKMLVVDGVHQLGLETRSWGEKRRKLFELGSSLRKVAGEGVACVVSNSFNRSFAQKRVESGFEEQYLNSENRFEKSKSRTKDTVTRSFRSKIWDKKFVFFGDLWSWVAQERFQLDRIEGLEGRSKRLFQVWFSRSLSEKRLWFEIEHYGLVFSEIQIEYGERDSEEEEQPGLRDSRGEARDGAHKPAKEETEKDQLLRRIFGEKKDFRKWN